jgi:hypothetical protein
MADTTDRVQLKPFNPELHRQMKRLAVDRGMPVWRLYEKAVKAYLDSEAVSQVLSRT